MKALAIIEFPEPNVQLLDFANKVPSFSGRFGNGTRYRVFGIWECLKRHP
ncbi:MAG: hypothetical protein AVDCRST_MAG93-8200 [uncultured Chloroflexia bacterium]|uniref:Uncharacterized protein n=1 Tax=uncultured Chloroflexia bacterium TaxID=1672391 RepID=A0A6J4MTU7_9CHLR|nr:MAG: hypothetical protein AVDCRST_MAG93-8200 [uncultured Chloroflexia bacterium]